MGKGGEGVGIGQHVSGEGKRTDPEQSFKNPDSYPDLKRPLQTHVMSHWQNNLENTTLHIWP